MIPVLFIGIAIAFLCLAISSYILKLLVEKPHRKMIEVMKREIEQSKDSTLERKGWLSLNSYLYKTVKYHYYLEVIGFLIAFIAAIIEFL